MKRIYTILVAVLITASVLAQAPEKMSYQAVVRDASNQLVTNTSVGMQISILQSSATGTAVYIEKQNPTTNANGLITIEIGTGTVVSGDFSTIDWANDTYFIKTETDPAGGTNYTITGTSQLMSVPYALHAKTAESITGTVNYTEIDPVYTTSQASNITGIDINNLSNLSGVNTGDQDISGIATNIQAIQDTASQIRADIPDISGFITSETDPIYTTSQASNITSTDITNLGNLSGTNTGDQAISRIGLTITLTNGGSFQDSINTYTAGDGIDITNNVVSEHKYQIGDFAQGGIVFWLDETGEHGLVCAKLDQNGGNVIRWAAGTSTYTMARGDGLYAGGLNTAIIIANQGYGDGSTYAARICNELQITEGGKTYGDWYLPSKEELNLMYQNRAIIDSTATTNGGSSFSSLSYWSSTEGVYLTLNNLAWFQYNDGLQDMGNKESDQFLVRAVRTF